MCARARKATFNRHRQVYTIYLDNCLTRACSPHTTDTRSGNIDMKHTPGVATVFPHLRHPCSLSPSPADAAGMERPHFSHRCSFSHTNARVVQEDVLHGIRERAVLLDASREGYPITIGGNPR